MQETLSKAILVKPIAGMNQYQEALGLSDPEFSLVSGTYPLQQGIQARIPGKVLVNTFGSSVLSIADFLGSRIVQTLSNGLYKEDATGTFATLQSSALTQTTNRDCFAVSPNVQLCVRSNGEERTKVIDTDGNIFDAEIPSPAAAPTLVVSVGGGLIANKWYCYAYCYASTKYPNIQRTLSINGRIGPRGNPSPSLSKLTTVANKNISITVVFSPRIDIDLIWIFRSTAYSTQAEADNAGAAGLLYFVAEIPNANATTPDTGFPDGVDQIENDNFKASSFKNVIYFHPYWIGFGAEIFKANATWTVGRPSTGGGVITLTGTEKFYAGRAGQHIKFSGITTGGIDGKGTYEFAYLTATTGTIIDRGSSLAVSGAGTQYITIFPPTASIYRSKAYDPFAWGWTRIIGTSIESLEWILNVGGGVGTAIATIPNESILKVDTNFPTRSYAFNLQMIDDFDQIKRTQKTVSESFSVTSQASQFPAQTKTGNTVLWGMDYNNFAILQSNGITQNQISFPLQNVLRNLTANKADQVFCHGIYDPVTQCNCMWVTLSSSPSRVHYLIYQHAPTGFWGVMEDLDVLCSARIQDLTTGAVKIMLGTEAGLYGQGFVPTIYQNWGGVTVRPIQSSTSTVITFDLSITFASALIGCWMLITDTNGQNEQWARISALTLHTLTVDRVYTGGIRFATLQIVPSIGWLVYIGLIECRLQKYFDFTATNTDKKFQELWIGQQNSVNCLVRIYREWSTALLSQITLTADKYHDTTPSTAFVQKKLPAEKIKSIQLELINREYTGWILRYIVLKYLLMP